MEPRDDLHLVAQRVAVDIHAAAAEAFTIAQLQTMPRRLSHDRPPASVLVIILILAVGFGPSRTLPLLPSAQGTVNYTQIHELTRPPVNVT